MTILLETKHLIVKAPSRDALEDLYLLLSDADVMRHIGRGPRTREEVREGIEKMIVHHAKHGFSLGNVYEKETGLFVGRAGLVYLAMDDTQPEIEVGYALHKKFWNKGYATELSKAFIQWGFQHLPIKYLVAVTHPENDRSRQVLEKSGMRYIGREDCYDTEVAKYIIYKPDIDYDKVELIPATLNDYPIIQNLARFYSYDISEYYGLDAGWEMEADGLYGVGIDYKQYWETENTYPFLIRYKGELAGFAIIDKKGSDESIDFNMAQFCILRMYKSQGIGKYIATKCFDKFRGTWEIMVMPGNEGAYRFWKSVVRDYSKGDFIEYTRRVVHFKNEKRNFFKWKKIKVNTIS